VHLCDAGQNEQRKISLLKAYGAEVVITPTAVPPDSPESYYSVANRLAAETPGGFQPNQYYNQANPDTHYHHRTRDLATDRRQGGRICGGRRHRGTVTGTGRLKEHNPDLIVVGADPEDRCSGGDVRPYKVEGVGEDFWPGVRSTIVDRCACQRQGLVSNGAARDPEEGILGGLWHCDVGGAAGCDGF
jgi:cystathionine beta-synthase